MDFFKSTFFNLDGAPYIVSGACGCVDESNYSDIDSCGLAGYHSIMKDLDTCVKLMEETGKSGDKFLKEIYWKYALLLFGKCFATGEGRKIKLKIRGYGSCDKSTVEKFVDSRNEYIAHAGKNDKEACCTLVLLKTEEPLGFLEVKTASVSSSFPGPKEVEEFLSTINHVKKGVYQKISKLITRIEKYYSNIPVAELYKKAIYPPK